MLTEAMGHLWLKVSVLLDSGPKGCQLVGKGLHRGDSGNSRSMGLIAEFTGSSAVSDN